MLKIDVVCVGSIKESFYKEAASEYLKRLSRYASVNVIEVAEQSNQPEERKIALEGELILSRVKGHMILLDRQGTELSSPELAGELERVSAISGSVCFVIGGSNGVAKAVKDRADKVISFGKITFPHQLFRVVLLEQLYRAFTIISGTPYHK